jgi:hypothetical protein
MKYAVFLVDLNQDVAAFRHVAHFFRRESSLAILFLVSDNFRKRDALGVWRQEVQEICRELAGEWIDVDSVGDVIRSLTGKAGLLLSASESALTAHAFNHAAFLAAPDSFVRVTLQHGLECIGFNHNDAHDRTWHHYVGMACDVAASWFESEALHSVRADQRSKIITVGPPLGLDSPPPEYRPQAAPKNSAIHGLVCENLHSVRFSAGAKNLFVDALSTFAEHLAPLDGTIELRPHPGGLYLERNKVPLPPNVRFNRLPLYRQGLDKFSFCISGPSSVLLDMVWANVPVAVWTSGESSMSIGAYSELHVVSSEAEWLDFAVAATMEPGPFLEAQAMFIDSLKLPPDIPGRYRQLLKLVPN